MANKKFIMVEKSAKQQKTHKRLHKKKTRQRAAEVLKTFPKTKETLALNWRRAPCHL